MNSQSKFPSLAVDELEANFKHRTDPNMSWGERDIGYAVAVREMIAYMRQNSVHTTLGEPYIITAKQ